MVLLVPAPTAAADELDRLMAKGDGLDPVHAALAVGRLVEPGLDAAPVEAALSRSAASLRIALRTAKTPAARVAALAHAVHSDLNLRVEDEPDTERDLAAILPHHVLARRRGACLGLSLIYLSLARRAGLELSAVTFPGHILVRHGELNVETTLQGLSRDEAWYRVRTGLPPAPAKAANYLRPLRPAELVAVLLSSVGGSLVQEDQDARALPLLRRACRLSPDDPDAHYNLALALRNLGRRPQALEQVDRSLELFRAKEALNLRGLLRLDARPDLAEADFSGAVALDPQQARYHNNLGAARCRQGRLREALPELDRALALRPDWPQALQNRGLAHLELGQLDPALADLRAAPPADWRALLRRLPNTAAQGRTLVRLGETFGRDRTDAAAAALLEGGDRLLAAKAHQEAKRAFDRVLDLGAERVEAYCKRGLACERLGDDLWAKRNYYLATQADPSAPLGYRFFGYYYLRRDRYAIAADYFRKYLDRSEPDAQGRAEVTDLVREIEEALGRN